jgi:hypothetical protein
MTGLETVLIVMLSIIYVTGAFIFYIISKNDKNATYYSEDELSENYIGKNRFKIGDLLQIIFWLPVLFYVIGESLLDLYKPYIIGFKNKLYKNWLVCRKAKYNAETKKIDIEFEGKIYSHDIDSDIGKDIMKYNKKLRKHIENLYRERA